VMVPARGRRAVLVPFTTFLPRFLRE